MTENPLLNVVALTERLIVQITRENTLLKDRKPREVKEFHSDKVRLTELYTREMETLKRNRALIDDAPPADLVSLKSVTARFRETLDKHNSIVYALKSVTEGMVKAVAVEVSRRNNPVEGYGMDAIMKKQGAAAATSIALNQVV